MDILRYVIISLYFSSSLFSQIDETFRPGPPYSEGPPMSLMEFISRFSYAISLFILGVGLFMILVRIFDRSED